MSDFDCNSVFCFHYGEYEFCKCKKASRKKSAAWVQECRAYRKLKQFEEQTNKSKCNCGGCHK